jgi:hypothetical protein
LLWESVSDAVFLDRVLAFSLTILARASLLMNAEKDGAGLPFFGTVFYREKE